MTLEMLLAGCIGIVFVTALSTWVLSLKEQYAGGTAYSREQMKNLLGDSLEYQIVRHFYSKEALLSFQDPAVHEEQQAEIVSSSETVSADSDIEIQKIYGSIRILQKGELVLLWMSMCLITMPSEV